MFLLCYIYPRKRLCHQVINVSNIVKRLYLAPIQYESENSATITDEILTAELFFKVLKSFKDSDFSELYSYDTLEFDDEYEEMSNIEESDDDTGDYKENENSNICSQCTFEEMKNIIEWIDWRSDAKFSTISNRSKGSNP